MKFKQHQPIVLASGSPRRKAYLERYQLSFKILTKEIEEIPHPKEEPIDFVKRMAIDKAKAASEFADIESLLISADTIVVLGNQIIGKPDSPDAIFPMLKALNGQTHQVITSYVILEKVSGKIIQREVSTEVKFNKISEDLLALYAKTEEPRDKAGAYSIQGIGTFLVQSINGSYNNVVGLPIEKLIDDLLKIGVLSIA